MTDAMTLGMLLDEAHVERILDATPLAEAARRGKARLLSQAVAKLAAAKVSREAKPALFWVPGRIEVLGKHTDYGGGRTVVAAVEQGFCLASVPREDQHMRVFACSLDQETAFDIAPDLTPKAGHWSNYPMTVARRVARNFPGDLRGVDVAIASDLPPAAGMSTSSALLIGLFQALAAANDLAAHPAYQANISTPEDLAGYIATIENGQTFGTLTGAKGVGTFGGSEDHTAILCCRAGQLSQYSYCPVRFERFLPIPDDYVFAIGVSGVVAEKAGAAKEKYNRASLLAGRCAALWRAATDRDDPHLAAILADNPAAGDQLRQILQQSKDEEYNAADLVARYEHFRSESEEIIPQAGDALLAGDMEQFGRLVDLSQALAETLLGTQIPETVSLARTARQLGAVAASAFGAGYGGSVWALVARDQAGQFLPHWQDRHQQCFAKAAEQSSFFLTEAGPAALRLQ